MGLTYTELKITNLFTRKSIDVRFLVDTGAVHTFITADIALQLGFDPEEMPRRNVTVADGRHFKAPIIGPLELRFDDHRDFMTDAMVLGDEPLMGVLALEALDLIVDPSRQQVVVNPKHPNFPVYPVKGGIKIVYPPA